MVVFFALLVVIQLCSRPPRPVPDTTAIAEPLNEDCSADYPAALNDICSHEVIAENNFVVLLVQAIGPEIAAPQLRASFFEQLGIPCPPDGEQYIQEYPAPLGDKNESRIRRSPWISDDSPDIAATLAANEGPLAVFADACRRTQYYMPVVVPPDGTALDATASLIRQERNLSRLLSVRITLRLGEDDVDAALADSITLHRFSAQLGRDPRLTQRLVSYGVEAVACFSDSVIIQSGKLTPEHAHRQRMMLSEIRQFDSLADLVDRYERLTCLHLACAELKVRNWNTAGLSQSVVIQKIDKACDQVVAAMKLQSLVAQRTELAAVRKRWQAANSRDVAASLSARLIPPFESALLADVRTRLKRELTLIGYALVEYKAVHGAYPDTLNTLVPELLESIPADPFGEGPIRYMLNAERGTFLLYGVGTNGQDDGGRGDDVSFGDVPEE